MFILAKTIPQSPAFSEQAKLHPTCLVVMPELPCFDVDPFNLCSTREGVTFRIQNIGSVGLLAPRPTPRWEEGSLWRISCLPLAPLCLDRWSTDLTLLGLKARGFSGRRESNDFTLAELPPCAPRR